MDAFLSDYNDATSRADTLDAKIALDTTSLTGSSALQNIISLSAPFAMGGTEITISNGTDGNWNTSDVKMFMKDIGSGTTQCDLLTLQRDVPSMLTMLQESQSSRGSLCVVPLLHIPERVILWISAGTGS